MCVCVCMCMCGGVGQEEGWEERGRGGSHWLRRNEFFGEKKTELNFFTLNCYAFMELFVKFYILISNNEFCS